MATAAWGHAGPPGALGAVPVAEPIPEEGRLILITTVDIGEGNSDKIEVRAGDDPLDLARAFVHKHALPEAVVEALAQHLHENLRQAAAAQEAAWRRSGGSLRRGSKAYSSGPGYDSFGGAPSVHSDGAGSLRSDADSAVFERLYEHATVLRRKLQEKKERIAAEKESAVEGTRHHMSWISAEMMKQRTSGPYENYGEMLYAESLEGIARRRQKAERERATRAEAELSTATFQPEISRLAQHLWSRQDGSAVPAWQRLSKVKKSKTAERLEMLRREREEAETRECTFKPAISKRSDKLMSERADTLRSLNLSAHQQLYQDSLRRQQKQSQYANWFPEDVTFRPKLIASQRPPSSKAPSRGGAPPAREEGRGDTAAMVERLYSSYEKLQTKLSEARAKLDGDVDPATGRALYKPQTGRAPYYTRHAPEQGVGDYLYSLQTEKDEKARQRVAEEARRADEARRGRVDSSSAAIVRRLQRKRFSQVFAFLDRSAAGLIDLAALLEDPPAYLEELDDDVRDDLEHAARIAVRNTLSPRERGKVKHQDSGASAASSFFMPPPPGADVRESARRGGGAPPSPGPPANPSRVPLEAFCGLMEEAIAARPRPRAYLAPSPPQKYEPAETFAPRIDARSKAIAAKLRPKDTPLHELLHREATSLSAKKAALRAAAQDAQLRECTFAPRLVSEQLVPEGRVMKEMREGLYSHPLGAAAAALTNDEAALEALVAATIEAEAAACEGDADPHGAPCLQGEGPSFTGALQDLAAHLQAGPGMGRGLHGEAEDEDEYGQEEEEEEEAGGEVAYGYDHVEEEEEAEEEGAAEYCPEADAEAEAASGGSGASGVRRLEEIEAEVEAMLAATTAAAERIAANAGAGSGGEEGAYLSEVLGRAQAAVDAMAESFPGWEARFSSGSGGKAAATAAAAAAAGSDYDAEAEAVAAAAAAAEAALESRFTAPPGEEAAAVGGEPAPVDFDPSWDEEREEPEPQQAGSEAVAAAAAAAPEGEVHLAAEANAPAAEGALADADGDVSSIWGGPATGPGVAAADADAEWDAEELEAEKSAPLIEL
ncbi:hypothetical protein Rsub_10136 [Raphidocelis subcapitata]|uniref:PFU domain-containing protein n=1 Tax=Raphidocelis subcapitata TaxID=307507 RepID=A0A2V0PJA4_9CHLO|nr:hypothetical protein Rsub_10136 [Raphidocelis subcapitata]|eukprot:GBF97125.1 hypothetical protein Rsub_10136 [Raphidocelis subcapitata]